MLTSACNRGILDPVGPVGGAEKQILINSTAIMLAIIIPTMIATIAFAWWFRRGNTQGDVPARLGIFGRDRDGRLGDPGADHHAARRDRLDRQPRSRAEQAAHSRKIPPLKVDVVSLDWKWLFIYPDQGIATVNQLVVPAGTPVSFRLTSATVWNSFFVPQMGTMIYTMPRMTTRLNLQADRPGVYDGLSVAFQRRRLPGHAVQGPGGPAGPVRDVGAGRARSAPTLDGAGYAELLEAEQLREADDLRRGRARTCSTRSSPTGRRANLPQPPPAHNEPASWNRA